MDKNQLPEGTYGRKISLKEANEMVKEFLDLDALIKKEVTPGLPNDQRTKATELKSRDFNAFIFHREFIDRFFHPSNSEPAEYLMVVLGAHLKDEKVDGFDFKAGSFTVITTGCKMETNPVNRDNPKFYAIKTQSGEEPANEYPPRRVIAKIEHDEGGEKRMFFTMK